MESGEALLPLVAENTQRPKQTASQEGVKYAEIANLIHTLSR